MTIVGYNWPKIYTRLIAIKYVTIVVVYFTLPNKRFRAPPSISGFIDNQTIRSIQAPTIIFIEEYCFRHRSKNSLVIILHTRLNRKYGSFAKKIRARKQCHCVYSDKQLRRRTTLAATSAPKAASSFKTISRVAKEGLSAAAWHPRYAVRQRLRLAARKA